MKNEKELTEAQKRTNDDKTSKFIQKFYDREVTKKLFLLKGTEIVGIIYELITPSYVSVFIKGDNEVLGYGNCRRPTKASGYGYDKESSAIEHFYREFGINVSDEDIRLIGSGQIYKYYKGRGITLLR